MQHALLLRSTAAALHTPLQRVRLGAYATVLGLALAAPHLALAADAPTATLGYSPANMDKSVSPRQDFYRYATGAWLQRNSIPASEADVSGFTQLLANLDNQLLTLIQGAAASPGVAGSARQQIGDFWRSAMDLKRLDDVGLQPLQADLKRFETTGTSAKDMAALSARLQLGYSVSPLVNAFSSIDAKNSTMNLLVIHPGLQALEQDQYTKPAGQQIRDLYLDHMRKMFQSTGDTTEQAAANAATVLAIETELAAARLTPLQQRDPATTYNLFTPEEVQAMIPAVDLKAFLTAMGVAPQTRIQVMDVGGLKAVQHMLTTRTSHDLQTLLRWHALSSRASALGQPWRGLDQEFNRLRLGLEVPPTRERDITQLMGAQLFHPLSKLYVESYFPESTRRDITEMVGHVKNEFELRLRNNPWLDEPTRAAALDKLSKVDVQVGYPQHWIDFSSIQIKPDDFFGNNQRISEFMTQRDLSQVGNPVKKERFAAPGKTTPISVNAAYSPQTNSIDITAAIVQPPFYKPGADAAVNYCTIGAVIGHELTHGFDSMGRQFGPAGNVRDWWTPKATAEFKKRTDVLVKQYSQFTILPGLKHNGLLTLTENTADLGGISLAYAALQRHLSANPLPIIDGMNSDQRCFVAWSQMWAYKGRPERLRLLATTDVHANTPLRGFAPLVHLDAFHKAFGTRPGDPMWRDPAKRVRIW